ncbi:MAG TPA: methyltransferase domain-containing protein [Thermomicrobiales bacterium]|nr:methyltransferase domain-containing protein [Thermomicrobiales bacterium]
MDSSSTGMWSLGDAYEPYAGRWSRLVAREFLDWLNVPPGSRWLDVGCGTGAVSSTILAVASPSEVTGVDPSPGFASYAREHVRDPRATFMVGDATALPFPAAAFDATVAGLVLNFVSDTQSAVAEMTRVTRAGGVVGAYVWDYGEGMEMMRAFWNAALAIDPSSTELDQGQRFAASFNPDAMVALFEGAGLHHAEAGAIVVPTVFRDFDDFWTPFLGAQGGAPSYLARLNPDHQAGIRDRLRSTLPVAGDGSIHLSARAWAAKGTR